MEILLSGFLTVFILSQGAGECNALFTGRLSNLLCLWYNGKAIDFSLR
jgi:hypothetical protein